MIDKLVHKKNLTVRTASEVGELTKKNTLKIRKAFVLNKSEYHKNIIIRTVSESESKKKTGESISKKTRFILKRHRVIIDNSEDHKKILT